MTDKDCDVPTNSEVENESAHTSKSDLNCSVCNIHVTNKVELRQHLVGQKHKKAYRLLEEQQRVNKQCGLFIKGFSTLCKLEELVNYFQDFGSIAWVHMGIGFLLLDYEEAESADTVLSKSHSIGGRKLYIQRRQYKEPRVQKIEDYEDVVNKLINLGELSLQVQRLKYELQVDCSQNYTYYNKVYEDLSQSLREYFPYCTINPFGSTVTGLSFRNSDVDVYISGVSNSKDNVQSLFTIKDILNRSRKFFNIIVIAHAKIPIVKCVHKETFISCDINMKNMLGVCNSQLIKFYINHNEKIKDMMIILKYWAKIHIITGKNHLFTNYALCLMVIFFLQLPPYDLPSVSYLQKFDNPYRSEDYWIGTFRELYLYKPTVETFKKTSLLDMLKGFFNLYSNFDYEKNIICPYLGKITEKDIFRSSKNLPNCYHLYKEFIKQEGNKPLKIDSCICVQDPFEHARNNTSVILNSVLSEFVGFCKLGSQLCEAGDTNLLYKLFTEDLQVAQKIDQVSNSKITQLFTISMGENVKYLQNKIQKYRFENLDRVVTERKAWFDTIVEFFKIFLKDIMNFHVQEDSNNGAVSPKQMKGNDQKSVHDKESVHFKCSGKLNVWDMRKNKAKQLVTREDFRKKNFVEKEIAITQSIKTYCGFKPTMSILAFDFFIKFHSELPKVDIQIRKISCYKSTFKTFSNYLEKDLKDKFLEYENMLNLEVSKNR